MEDYEDREDLVSSNRYMTEEQRITHLERRIAELTVTVTELQIQNNQIRLELARVYDRNYY